MTSSPECTIGDAPVTCQTATASSLNLTDYDIVDSGSQLFDVITGRFVPIVFCFISILGIVGNILVIAVALSTHLTRNTTNVLIANLAIADLIFIVVCVPFTAVIYAVPSWPFGDAWCKIYQYLIQATAYVSVYTLVLMSLDRYLAVVHPVRSMSIRTERNAYLVSGALWASVLVFNVPILLENAQFDYQFGGEKRSICINVRVFASQKDGDDHYGRIFYGSFFAFAYALPLATVCILYGLMLRRLLQGSMSCRRNPGSDRVRSNRRVTRMVVIVVVVFAVCWLPLHLVIVVQYFALGGSMERASIIIPCKIIATCIAYLNSCVNPLLYAFLSENFRRTFRRVIGSYKQRKPKSGELSDRPTRPIVQTTRGKEGLSMEPLANA